MASSDELLLQYEGHIVPRSFHAGFVVLSYVISWVGAASTLELINRRTSTKGWFNNLLLCGSAITMGGVAIWCMHFIGNQAIELADDRHELQISYSSGFTALSFFVPILVLLAAFAAVGTNNTVSWWRVATGGTLTGFAVCGMHYLGNASISNYACVYSPVNIVGANLIAVAASNVALAIFFVFRAAWTNSWWKRLGTAVVLASAVSGMHWVAATGTQYRLIHLNENGSSRNVTAIVIICLSVGACLTIAGIAIATARIKRRSADKAQQVVLAAAVFDKHGRILVSPDGLVPSEKITDTFLGKHHTDRFTIAHPLFHWMFQASRNWSGISKLIDGMSNHLSQLPHRGKDRDARSSVKLINEHGELVDHHDVIFRELFCTAAASLAGMMKEDLESVGILWDEILVTGGEQLRPAVERPGQSDKLDDVSFTDTTLRRDSSLADGSEDLAEKGLPTRHREYGRGSLMFLVRRLHSDGEAEKLEAAGYRFAEIRQISGIIQSTMQVKTENLEGILQEMSTYSDDRASMEQGVHIGFFGLRPSVSGHGFDVLVRRDARSMLPTAQMQLSRLEGWQLDFLKQFDGMSPGAMQRQLQGISDLSSREAHFVPKLRDAIANLRLFMDDAILEEATFASKPVALPCRSDDDTNSASCAVVAFHLVIPLHATITSQRCCTTPLTFFKVQQEAGRWSPHNAAFTRSVHRELAPILRAVPSSSDQLKESAHAAGRRGPYSISQRLNRFRQFEEQGIPYSVGAFGKPVPTVVARAPSPTPSTRSTTELKLWPERHSVDQASSGLPGLSNDDGSSAASPSHSASGPRAFGGIMISQEVTVDIQHANCKEADMTSIDTSPANSVRKSHKRGASLRNWKGASGGLLSAEATDGKRTHARPGGAIEMEILSAPSQVNLHAGPGTQTSNVEVEKTGKATTFVDELVDICIRSR